MDMNQITTFVQISKARSLSDGARGLGKSKSTVSAQISALENRLGVRLFRRTTRKLALTSEGHDLLRSVETAVTELLEVERVLAERKGTFAGHVRISAPQEIPKPVLARAILGFTQKHPGVSCELCLSNDMSDFVDDDIDIAIRGGHPVGQETMVRRIGDVGFTYCASPDYVDRHGAPKTFGELGNHRCLGFSGAKTSQNSQRRGQPLERWASQKSDLASDSMDMLVQLAKLDAGIAFLPTYVCKSELESGALVPVLSGVKPYRSMFSLQFPSRRESTPMIRALSEKIRADLRASGITE